MKWENMTDSKQMLERHRNYQTKRNSTFVMWMFEPSWSFLVIETIAEFGQWPFFLGMLLHSVVSNYSNQLLHWSHESHISSLLFMYAYSYPACSPEDSRGVPGMFHFILMALWDTLGQRNVICSKPISELHGQSGDPNWDFFASSWRF